MSPLVKKLVFGAASAAAAVGIGIGVDKYAGLKNAAGQPISVNPLPGTFDAKRLGLFAAVLAAGSAAVYFLAKTLKINLLK